MSQNEWLSIGDLPESARCALGLHLAELRALGRKSEQHHDIVALELQLLDLEDVGNAICSFKGLADAMRRSSALAAAKSEHFTAMAGILEQFV